MAKHVEMIIDYVINTDQGEDFQYCDNKGILTRCRDCVYANPYDRACNWKYGLNGTINELDFCSKAVRKPDHNS